MCLRVALLGRVTLVMLDTVNACPSDFIPFHCTVVGMFSCTRLDRVQDTSQCSLQRGADTPAIAERGRVSGGVVKREG